MAPFDHAQYVVDGRTGRRCYDPDTPGKERERFLVARVEKPFLPEPGLELLECQLKRTHAFGFDVFKDELILAARFVDAHPASANHLHAVLERELDVPLRRAEEDGPYLALFVLEREVGMTGLGDTEVRDFPQDPHIREISFDQIFNLRSELGDG
jgi:hypothetical protein